MTRVVRPTHLDAEAGGIKRTLRVHVVVYHIAEDINVTLRLHKPTHVRKAREEFAVLRHHRRNDSVVRALPPGQHVRVLLIQAEVRAAALEREAAALGDEATPKSEVDRVHHRDRVALAVDDLERDRVGTDSR